MPLDRIVIATGNPHKVRELRAILEKLGVDALALSDLGAYDEPPETGATFEANASTKALYYARATGLACLADDSGLEVDALGGAPGVISSHWCTDGREQGMTRDERDRLNNQRLLREMAGVAPEDRAARFVCVMALAGGGVIEKRGRSPGRMESCPTPQGAMGAGILATTRGTFEGRIGMAGEVPRGERGFGYDPMFLVAPECVRTSAELDPEEKNARSHRAMAARLMAERIAGMRVG